MSSNSKSVSHYSKSIGRFPRQHLAIHLPQQARGWYAVFVTVHHHTTPSSLYECSTGSGVFAIIGILEGAYK